jgi:hypothetical protein
MLAVVERIKDAIVELIAEPIVPEPDALLRLAIRGWIGSAEECALLWIRERPCDREVLVDLLMRAGLHLVALIGELTSGAPLP